MQNIIDVHCHLIPGVDDGAKSLEEALEAIYRQQQGGCMRIILTPHFRRRMFEPDKKKVYENYKLLKQEVRKQIPEMRLYLGCEVHASMGMVDRLHANPHFTMAGSDYVLVEFSESDEIGFIKERLRAVYMAGFKPIIAHAERYPKLMKRFDVIEELIDMGIWIQVNADSILGKDGWGTKRLCKKLMKEGFVHLVGSDAHNLTDRPSRLCECADFVEKKYGHEYAEQLFVKNPMKILKIQESK